jgi:transcription elongation factor Elf1
MFDDIITPQDKPTFNWDFDKYDETPYCPSCGSTDTKTGNTDLKRKKLVNEKKCNFCGKEWKEVYNEELELELLTCKEI